jgi:hypothetical protein
MMGVENQRPEDIKVAGRESWTNCECRMLEHLILSGSRNVGGIALLSNMRIPHADGCITIKPFYSWLINLLPTRIL